MKKGILENLAKFTRKHLWFAKFLRTLFLQNNSATATLLRWDTANSVWKTSDEYSLSRYTTLRSTVQVHHFFLDSINFHCVFSLVCISLLPEAATRVEVFCKKDVLKNFVNFKGKQLCCSLFLIKFQAWHHFKDYLLKTAFALHTHHWLLLIRFTLYSAPSSSSSLLLFSSSRPEVFYKKDVLRYFAKFTGKHLCKSLFFTKVAGIRPAILLKKRFWHWCFPMNFAKFLRSPFVTEQLWWLLLTTVNIFDVCFWFKFKSLQRI